MTAVAFAPLAEPTPPVIPRGGLRALPPRREMHSDLTEWDWQAEAACRTADPELKILATDIALGQQAQIGRMSGWLDEWGLSQTSTRTPMAWMRADNLLGGADGTGASMGGMDMGGMGTGSGGTMALLPDGRMPGMATRPQSSHIMVRMTPRFGAGRRGI